MPREFSRGRRVGDQIQQELARLIQFEINDPRVGMVTINDVKVSRDLAYADVYFTMMGEGDPAETEVALGHAAGFLRTRLSKMLATRTTPRLRFHYDSTIETGARLNEAINEAVEADRRRRGDSDEHED